jgi:GPH family glycoside/pentoside/hexuronide:cation symporter
MHGVIPLSVRPGERCATLGDVLAYASGSLGTGVFTTVPAVLLLFYCTDVLSITPAHAAVIVLAPKLWALVWDPLVGAWSDRTLTRWGRRAPFMLVGAGGVAVAFIAVFSTPHLEHSLTALWVGAAYFLLTCLYSLYAVPYIAIPAETPAGPAHGLRLISWRMAFVMVGVLLGASGAPLLAAAAGGGRDGYSDMSFVIAAVCVITMCPVIVAASRKGDRPLAASDRNPLSPLRALRAAPEFGALAISYALQMTAAAVISAMMPYLVTRTFGRSEGETGIAMLVVLSFTILAVPLWAALARHTGERLALMCVVGIYAAAVVLPWLALHFGWGWRGFLGSLSAVGIGFAGLQVLPFALMARVVRARGGDNQGLLTGVWTASEKVGLALGPALTAAALGIAGERSTSLPAFAAAVPAALLLMSLVPALIAVRDTP